MNYNKRWVFLAISVLLLVFLFSIVRSLEYNDINNLQTNIEENNITKGVKALSAEETRSVFLKQEWTKFFEKSRFGRGLLKISDFFTSLNPVFLFLLGTKYSLSWVFCITFLIWFTLLVLVYKPVKNIFQVNPLMCLILSLAVAALAVRSGAVKKSVELTAFIIKNTWSALLFVVILLTLLSFFSSFMKKIGKKTAEMKKKENEERREEKDNLLENVKDIEIQAKTGKKPEKH